MNKSAALVLLCLFAFLGCDSRSSLERSDARDGRRRTPGSQPSPLPGDLLARFDVHFVDGARVPLAQLIGQKKVVIINFWATWCGPCRREIPELTSLDREYKGKDVEIVGLSVEDPTSATEIIRMFGEQYSIRYRLGFASEELFDAFSGTGQRAVVPQTFIFDRSGQLRSHLRGLHPDFREIVRETIEAALTNS